MKKVTVYSLSTCPVCKKVKRLLDDNSIPYTLIEVDLLEAGEQWVTTREVAKRNPAGTYPTTVVEEVIIGYDVDALRAKVLGRDGS
ncbi:MAG: glutaredoxin [Nitrospirae bacterium]|nr:MAG: glutaredoxin [Nitrospirota bacterium]